MARKIIQIAATPDVEIIALCSDGSLWIAHHNGIVVETWRRIPDVPQHDGLPKVEYPPFKKPDRKAEAQKAAERDQKAAVRRGDVS